MEIKETLLISLDYDDTFTANPIFWKKFIDLAIEEGHRIVIATMRHEHEGRNLEILLADHVEKIIYTGRKAKKPFLKKLGIEPDIWVDDMPEFLVEDAKKISLSNS